MSLFFCRGVDVPAFFLFFCRGVDVPAFLLFSCFFLSVQLTHSDLGNRLFRSDSRKRVSDKPGAVQ